MSVFELDLLIDIDMCFYYLMTNKYQMKGGYADQNIITKVMELFHCLIILWLKIQRYHRFEICKKTW